MTVLPLNHIVQSPKVQAPIAEPEGNYPFVDEKATNIVIRFGPGKTFVITRAGYTSTMGKATFARLKEYFLNGLKADSSASHLQLIDNLIVDPDLLNELVPEIRW